MKNFYFPILFLLISNATFSQVAFEVVSDKQLVKEFADKDSNLYVSDAEKHFFIKGFEFTVEEHSAIPREDKKMKYYYFVISAHKLYSRLAPFMLKTQELLDPSVLNMKIQDNICSIVINETIEGNLQVETSTIELQLPEL